MTNLPPPPGWYPDPSGTPGRQRYFDGQKWTDRFNPPAEPPPVPAAAQREVPPAKPRGQEGPPAEGIRQILALDAPRHLHPALSELQELVIEIFEQTDAEGAGETPLVEALATALIVLEQSHIDTKLAVLRASNVIKELYSNVLTLATQLEDAGVAPGRSGEIDFIDFDDLNSSINEMFPD